MDSFTSLALSLPPFERSFTDSHLSSSPARADTPFDTESFPLLDSYHRCSRQADSLLTAPSFSSSGSSMSSYQTRSELSRTFTPRSSASSLYSPYEPDPSASRKRALSKPRPRQTSSSRMYSVAFRNPWSHQKHHSFEHQRPAQMAHKRTPSLSITIPQKPSKPVQRVRESRFKEELGSPSPPPSSPSRSLSAILAYYETAPTTESETEGDSARDDPSPRSSCFPSSHRTTMRERVSRVFRRNRSSTSALPSPTTGPRESLSDHRRNDFTFPPLQQRAVPVPVPAPAPFPAPASMARRHHQQSASTSQINLLRSQATAHLDQPRPVWTRERCSLPASPVYTPRRSHDLDSMSAERASLSAAEYARAARSSRTSMDGVRGRRGVTPRGSRDEGQATLRVPTGPKHVKRDSGVQMQGARAGLLRGA